MKSYVVQRVVPNDGIIGVHDALTMEDLGHKYGEGSYLVKTSVEWGYGQEPRVVEIGIKIGAGFGPPRMPDPSGGSKR